MKGQPQSPMFGALGGHVRERVKRLRLLRQWDQAELAERAGTSATTISQFERARVTPSEDILGRIASALGYSLAYITSDLQVETTQPWLRAYADASKREADARTGTVAIAVEYIHHLQLNPRPDFIPPFRGDLDNGDAIEEAAVETRILAGIELDAVIPNAVRAAERLGCVVLPLESELGRHLGMSVRADDIPVICVAKRDVPGDRQRLTVAHEIGHLVLHANRPPPRSNAEATRMERQAFRFAGAFLAPADALRDALNELGGKVTLTALAELKAMWGVAIKALVHRFHDLHMIDDDQARSLYKQISARKWSTEEPVFVPTEAAQWYERSLLRKAGVPELHVAANKLAAEIGGDGADLLSFADWTVADAEIVPLDDLRRARAK